MTDRIDHVAEAVGLISEANRLLNEFKPMTTEAAHLAAVAQVHATLALVEQQRIANLIALAHVADQHDNVSPLEQTAWEALGVPGSGVMRPDIAAALGLEVEE